MSKTTSKVMQFFQGTIVLTISNLLIKATSFFLLPLYTEYLSPDQLGIADSITNLMALIFPILVLSFDSAFSAFYFEEKTNEHVNKVFSTVFIFLLFSSILLIIPTIFARQISILMFDVDSYAISIGISMLSIALNMWFLPFSLHIRMQNRMTTFSIVSFLASLIMILLNILFVVCFSLGYFSLILSNFIVHAVQLILFVALSKIRVSYKLFDKQLFLRMLKFALPLVPMVVSGWLLSVSDRYIILYYLGDFDVGIYGIAARFQNVLTVITSAVYTAYSTFAFSSQEDKNANKNYSFVLDIVSITLLIITIIVSFISKEIISVFVANEYFESYKMIGPLLLGQVCYAANTIMGYGFSYVKKSSYYLVPSFTGAIVNVILNFLLIPKYGAYAATITTFIGYLIMMLMTYILVKKVYDCDYNFYQLLLLIALSFVSIVFTCDSTIVIRICICCAILLLSCYMYRQRIVEIKNVLMLKIKGDFVNNE